MIAVVGCTPAASGLAACAAIMDEWKQITVRIESRTLRDLRSLCFASQLAGTADDVTLAMFAILKAAFNDEEKIDLQLHHLTGGQRE